VRIIFIGTVKFSLKALEKLIDIKANLVGVCTKKKSNFNSDFSNLVPLCVDNEIPFRYVDNVNSEDSVNWISELSPDIIFCFGWSSLIKKELLSLAPMGVVGYHPTHLPKNRGRHPLIWALVLGLKKSASTFFFMDERADSGDILSQVEFDIIYEDDAYTIYERITSIAMSQIESFVPKLENKEYKKIKQDNNVMNLWRKRTKRDGVIDFRMNADAIYNLVRALTKPYGGATIQYNDEDIVVWKVEVVKIDMGNIEYGKILEIKDNKILVKAYDNAVMIVKHEFKTLPKVDEYL